MLKTYITDNTPSLVQRLMPSMRSALQDKKNHWEYFYDWFPTLLDGMEVKLTFKGECSDEDLQTLSEVAFAILVGIYERRVRDPLVDVVPPDDAVEARRLRDIADALERLPAEVGQRETSLKPLGIRLEAAHIRVHDLQKLSDEDPRAEIDSGPGDETPNLKRELEQAVLELENAQIAFQKEEEEFRRLEERLSGLRKAVASRYVDYQNYICVRR